MFVFCSLIDIDIYIWQNDCVKRSFLNEAGNILFAKIVMVMDMDYSYEEEGAFIHTEMVSTKPFLFFFFSFFLVDYV